MGRYCFVLRTVVALLGFAASVCLAAPTAFQLETERWHGGMAAGRGEVARVGDFDGNGRADVVAFTCETQPEPRRGDCYVALSTGSGLGEAQVWHENLCTDQTPVIGDFSGDGKDDVALLRRDVPGVMVALSDGARFADPVQWQGGFNPRRMTPLAGDVNGDGKDDLLFFVKSTMPGAEEADIYVLISQGTQFQPQTEKWHDFFCVDPEVPLVADFNGDGRADVLTYINKGSGQWNGGWAYVALSQTDPVKFGESKVWSRAVSQGAEIPAAADVNGDRKADLVIFTGSSSDATRMGNVQVALSTGNGFAAPVVWHRYFHIAGMPVTADFTGDGCADIANFNLNNFNAEQAGDVMVARAIEARAASNWRFRLKQFRCLKENEGGGDEPYFVSIGFRTRPGVRGSTRTWWNRNAGSGWAEDTHANRIMDMNGAQSGIVFDNVRVLSQAELDAGMKPEILGMILVAGEADSTNYNDRVNAIDTVRQVLEQKLKEAELLQNPDMNHSLRVVAEGYRRAVYRSYMPDATFTDDDDLMDQGLAVMLATSVELPGVVTDMGSGTWSKERFFPVMRPVECTVQDDRQVIKVGAQTSDNGYYWLSWALGSE